MKKGYHSTQRKIWGMFPASEFYGFVLGYAVAYILKGVLGWDTTVFPVILAAIGVAIGFWYDRKYFWEKDEPEEGELMEGSPTGSTGGEDEAPAGEDSDPQESMQQKLKKMFENQPVDEDEET